MRKNIFYLIFVLLSISFSARDKSSLDTATTNSSDSLNNFLYEEDLFETLFSEAKMFYAEAIISDLICSNDLAELELESSFNDCGLFLPVEVTLFAEFLFIPCNDRAHICR